MEPWKGRVAGRPREWENVHWRRFPLNLTKVCPWSLPSTTYLVVLRWPLVSASLCATLCTHSHQKWPRSSWRGGKIEDLMVLLTSSTDVKKHLFFKKNCSGCFSDGVYIPFTGITVRNGEKKLYEKIKNATHHTLRTKGNAPVV